MSLGYFNQPDKTAEAFIKDDIGTIWFHSGDIGEIRADGTLKVIGKDFGINTCISMGLFLVEGPLKIGSIQL